MKHLYNKKTSKLNRRRLRKEQTEHEAILWSKLRARRFQGLKFYRQYSVGRYILDFYCPQLRLAIELDGSQHLQDKIQSHDRRRTEFMRNHNIQVLRYFNTEIRENLEGVLEDLFQWVEGQVS